MIMHRNSAFPWCRWLASAALLMSTFSLTLIARADHTNEPDSVTLAGSLQTELGCSEDWAPPCADTQLQAGEDGVWRGTFTLPAGEWEYKAALNGSWDENYGMAAGQNGDNIPLSVTDETPVSFYYSHRTHWITDNVRSVVAAAVGDFQTHLGCPVDWAPDCLRAWLQDINGDGIYTFTSTDIPAGNYEAKVALNESWDESYGDNGANVAFTVADDGDEVTFTYNSLDNSVVVGDAVSSGDLTQAKAYWLDRETLAWAIPTDADVRLHFDADASLTNNPDGVSGDNSIPMSHDPEGMSDTLKEKFPHLGQLPVFTIAAGDLDQVPAILTQQIALSASNDNGNLIDATGLQIPGVLDDLFAYDGTLGPVYNGDVPTLKLWAPTAQSVRLLLYEDGNSQSEASPLPMEKDPNTGVWSITGSADWNRQYYRFELDVYSPYTQAIETTQATDPYTLSASTDGTRSQLVNLQDDDLKPEGWNQLEKPAFTGAQDMMIYEVHVRDFSVSDPEVPEQWRGKFKAFTVEDSLGMTHLKELKSVGLSHVHLLPISDCATIPENPEDRQTLTEDLSAYAPDSTEQQSAVDAIRANDAFNWCYDPHHFNLPEGSYATDPNGTARILEFRELVQALNEAGLRVVVDVVYNHTSQSGLGDKSVLDKVVPGYYHRLNANGGIERSTCCENTASEHHMMEKFMVDSLMLWAQFYKVDSFRFDLMGHHSKENILTIQEQLATLTQDEHGVEGGDIYLYGEGWNFGEVQNNARFEQATQLNMAGTGIGTFNDRFRDAVRGGSPFDTGVQHVANQSFINGLYYDPNAENSGSTGELERLMQSTDRIRIGLAGSLRDFEFVDWQGNAATGHYGADVGYTLNPQETINYIEKHDNETLFDINQYKIPLDRTPAERVRVHNMGSSLVLLAQGVPFMQAGQELMRSKSMDRDSYDSGDWFNLLDYSYQNNGWGRGLPPAHSTEASWDVIKPRLADPSLAIAETEILQALAHTKEMMAIRHSSKLFRLESGEAIQEQVSFQNTGTEQKPALIAMQINDSDADIDPERELIVVLFNAHTEDQALEQESWIGMNFELHPLQQDSSDNRLGDASFDSDTGRFHIPARTTAVFQVSQEPTDPDEDEEDRDGGGHIHLSLLALLALLGFGLRQRRR